MIRALIFDFDGLILDTESVDYASWRETYAAHGVELPLDEWQANIGTIGQFDPIARLERLLGRTLDRERVRSARRQRDEALLAAVGQRPNDPTRIHVLDRPRHRVRPRHEPPKPDPAVYEAALTSLGVEPSSAVAFEDSPHGVAAATAAGIFTVAVPNEMTRPLDLSAAHHRLESLADLSLSELLNGAWNAGDRS